MIILGIDPGSRVTGFGIIRLEGNQSFHLHHGCLRLTTTDNHARLHQIFAGLKEIIEKFQPQEAAIEQIFMHQNPNSALKLGQARGAALAAIQIPIAEYSARQVKQSVVGFGAAKKEQVQHMVKTLLNLNEKLQADAADALAIALCHAHSRFYKVKVKKSKRRSSWRNYNPKE